MYRYNTRGEYVIALFLLLLIIYIIAYPLINPSFLNIQKYNKELAAVKSYGDIGRYSLEQWVFQHGIYDTSYWGKCQSDITSCVKDISEKGYFRGVCADFAAVFSYYYMKLGYGDPVVVVIRTPDQERHAEVVFFDGDQFSVFYGLPGGVHEVYYGSEWIKMRVGNRTWYDELTYDLIRLTGRVPSDGQSLEEYLREVNKGKTGYVDPLILRVGPNTVSAQLPSPVTVSGACRLEGQDTTCPLSFTNLRISGLEPGVCVVNGWILVVKP